MNISKAYNLSFAILLMTSMLIFVIYQFKQSNSVKDLLKLYSRSQLCAQTRPACELRYQNSISPKLNRIINERNSLSRTFNNEIEMERVKNCLNNPVSSSGAFCSLGDGKHLTDDGLANELSKLLEGQTVLSLGEGPGEYRKRLLNMGDVSKYDAYDGTPGISDLTSGSVNFMDLSIPQYGLPIYDWVISIEVAEHIPQQLISCFGFENIFIGNVVRHARHGIVLSWGVTGQGGFHHVNNREPIYVENLMKQNCFVESKSGQILRNASSFDWLKRNVRVYHRDPKCPVSPHDG